MECRTGCGACCIAISISSPIPGMPNGKPAGIRCIHLSKNRICEIHGHVDYPEVCKNLVPMPDMCGSTFEEAFEYLAELEAATKPN